MKGVRMKKIILMIIGFMMAFSVAVNAEDVKDINMTSNVDRETTEKLAEDLLV
jgi:hypothetical protein